MPHLPSVSRPLHNHNQTASIAGNSLSYKYGNLFFDGTYNYTYDAHNRLITVWSPVHINALIERDRDADNDGSHTLEERLYAQQDANFNLTAITTTSGSVQERYLAWNLQATAGNMEVWPTTQ